MGVLIDGEWRQRGYGTKSNEGRFKRDESAFRSWITADGGVGPSGESGFRAEPDRYHLYVSLACPWAHRTLIFRQLKGLQSLLPISVVHWHMGEHGWTFESGPGVVPDPIHHARYLYEIYRHAKSDYSGRVTVPVLWDRQRNTIVSNESADIIRMLNSAFDDVGALAGDYYPADLREDIDAVNSRVYDTINNGVYKAGFASTQSAYEEAVEPLFESLDWLEQRLSAQRYLCGERLTEADWRLFTTLIRFDPVYHGHFKCNRRRIVDYPNLYGYLRELYQVPGVADTIDFDHIRKHYYGSHDWINPSGIVAVGPQLALQEAHQRESL